MPSYTHCMLDIETLNTTPDSVVATIGAVLFNPEDTDTPDTVFAPGSRTFYTRLDIQSQLDRGRTVSASTLAWWMGQSDQARKDAFQPSQFSVDVMLKVFTGHMYGVEHLWGNGSTFDNVIIEHLLRDYGIEIPWDYRAHRDLRTAKHMGQPCSPPDVGTAHNALDDAVYQVLCLQGYWQS
jgi:hypothetical protein